MLRRWTHLAFDNRLLDAKDDDSEGGNGGGSGSKKPEGGEGDEGSDDEGKPAPKGDEEESEDEIIEGLDDPKKASKLVKKLRKENATLRNRSKMSEDQSSKLKKALVEAGVLEDEEADPQEKLSALGAQLQGTSQRAAILEAAVEHSIPKGSLDYFEFLVEKKISSMKEGEEITEDDLASLALEAKKKSGEAPAKSGVGTGKGKEGNEKPKETPASKDMSAAKFAKLSIGEKSALYAKNPDEYNRLFADAKSQGLIRL